MDSDAPGGAAVEGTFPAAGDRPELSLAVGRLLASGSGGNGPEYVRDSTRGGGLMRLSFWSGTLLSTLKRGAKTPIIVVERACQWSHGVALRLSASSWLGSDPVQEARAAGVHWRQDCESGQRRRIALAGG